MEVKVYNTRQKVFILEMLKNNKNKHLTVDDMLFILNAQKVSVSRATLYRYLDVLVSTGDVKKYILSESDKACYQYVDSSEDCKEHFHLMCIDCGTLQHLECLQINEIINHVVQDHKFKVDPGRVVLYGLCEECQKNHQEE
jgi:Fur family ferric uptake transcriptional regulator